MPKEIDKRFDEIVAFAELEQFIDNQVKYYSSGMYVRLGFAVAVNMDPDILLVDEVLAVGDEAFQRKCLDRVRQFQREGRTIVFVTHAADLVRQICDRAAVLDHGKMVMLGTPGRGGAHLPRAPAQPRTTTGAAWHRRARRSRGAESRRPDPATLLDQERKRSFRVAHVSARAPERRQPGTGLGRRSPSTSDTRPPSRSTTSCSAWPSTTATAAPCSDRNTDLLGLDVGRLAGGAR